MTSAPLTLHLFGPMRILVDGESVPRARTRSVEWLLALLVLRHGQVVDRSWLAGLFWPESRESQALQNLRHALLSLRKALGSAANRIQSPTRDTLILDLQDADVDVLRFDRALRSQEEAALREAVGAYTGPLLEGCQAEWIFWERQSREQSCLDALEKLADFAEARADYSEALTLLRRAETLDPLRDSTQRRLMQALAAAGEVPAALRTYQEHRLRLHREMQSEPDTETILLYRRLQTAGKETPPRRGDSRRAVSPPPARPAAPPVSLPGPPPLAGASLPHTITTLIGREEEVQKVVAQILASRLVTLAGTGGIGKTRLAIESAREAAPRFAEGAAFIALAALSEAALLPSFVAASLGLQEEGSADPDAPLRSLVACLSRGPILLVLDNCEQLIEAAAALCQNLLERCPHLHILATSRQRLGVNGEIVWRVPSLASPDAAQVPHQEERIIADLLSYPATRLFVERAQRVRPGFRPTSWEEAQAVAQICHRLDGIPLAIELAAARVGVLTLPQIAARLDDRFRLLTDGNRGVLPRHQTLRALIDWSYDLLDAQERALFCRLSVFVDGCTLEAAQAICTAEQTISGGDKPASAPLLSPSMDLFDTLASLVDKSLVQVREQETGLRYAMLETVREYAGGKLRESGAEKTLDRHLTYFLNLAEEIGPALSGSAPETALSVVDSDLGNFRAALTWAQRPHAPADTYLRLAAALWPYWEMRGYHTEGREHLRAALDRAEPQPASARARALLGAATLASVQFDVREAVRFGEESLERFRTQQDRGGIAAALLCLGNSCLEKRDLNGARLLLTEGLELCRQVGWREGIASALGYLGRAAFGEGDVSLSRKLLEEGLAQAETLGDAHRTAHLLHNLAYVVLESGDAARARALQEQSLAIRRRLGYKPGIAHALNALGRAAQRQEDFTQALLYHEEAASLYLQLGNPAHTCNVFFQVGYVCYALGDYARACAAYEECLSLFQRLDNLPHLQSVFNRLGSTLFHLGQRNRARELHRQALERCHPDGDFDERLRSLERLAVVEAAEGDTKRAVRWIGTAESAREAVGTLREPWDQADWEETIAKVRAALKEEFAPLIAEGRARTLDQAAEAALR